MQRSRQATGRFGTSGLGSGRPATKDGHGLAADCGVGWVQRWKLLILLTGTGTATAQVGGGLAGWAVGEGSRRQGRPPSSCHLALLPTIDE